GAGILLNGVGPGSVLTPMTEPFFATEEGRAMLAMATPIALAGRAYGKPEELAEIIAFLATLRGRYLVGQIVYVDGGTEAIKRPGTI
ncbi:MAG TPA: SDR family oxidoreductase, partial [Novosphingobium sp.]